MNRIRPQSETSTRNIISDRKKFGQSSVTGGITRPSSRPLSRQNRGTPESLVPPVIYPLKDLQLVGKVCLPKGVNRTKLEQHISDSDFFSVFGMDRNTYYNKPQWKQVAFKKKANLF